MKVPKLYRDFYQISLESQHTAFVIAVAGDTRAAEGGVAVGGKLNGEGIDCFATAGAECQMDIAGTVWDLFRIFQGRLVHDLQPGAIVEGQKIGAEVGAAVVVAVIGLSTEITAEKIFCAI